MINENDKLLLKTTFKANNDWLKNLIEFTNLPFSSVFIEQNTHYFFDLLDEKITVNDIPDEHLDYFFDFNNISLVSWSHQFLKNLPFTSRVGFQYKLLVHNKVNRALRSLLKKLQLEHRYQPEILEDLDYGT